MKHFSLIIVTLCLIGCGGSTDTNPFAPVTSLPVEQITAPVADDQAEPEPVAVVPENEPVTAPVTTPEPINEPITEPEMTEEVIEEETEVFEQEEVTTYATIDPFLDKSLGCFLDGELIQTLTIRSDGLYVSQVQGGTYSVQENAWSTGEGVIYLQGRPAQTYTIGDRKLTRENASGVIECVEYVVEEQAQVQDPVVGKFEDYYGQPWRCQKRGLQGSGAESEITFNQNGSGNLSFASNITGENVVTAFSWSYSGSNPVMIDTGFAMFLQQLHQDGFLTTGVSDNSIDYEYRCYPPGI